MALNPYVGWGLSSLALYFLNRNSRSKSESVSQEPSALNVSQTKLGTPIPVVLGTTLVKSPLTVYFGDFGSKPYTETYAAHAHFNAWPLVFALIAQYIAAPATTTGTGQGMSSHGGPVTVTIAGKDMFIGPLLNALFMWLLGWLINKRNLKTTIQKGFKYYLGWQQLVCWGAEKLKLKKVYMNEKLVWEGGVGREEQGGQPYIIKVDNEELFGGPDEQGGFVGELHVYFGGDTQEPDQWMVDQMKASSIPQELQGLTPAYRPFVSVVVPKAYIGKQATIPKLWYEIENLPEGLNLEEKEAGPDANAAQILYEIHTNPDWGLGEKEELLHLDSLKEIAETLREEKMGLTVPLTQETTAGQVIDSVMEHVSAVKFMEPSTGQMMYKLIRDDTDYEHMYLLDETCISEISFTRLDWQETVSKVGVTYTDRAALYETGSLSDTDPANVEMHSGAGTEKTYSLPYFTNGENALWAAKRELNQQGYPLAVISLTGNRKLHKLRIGDVVLLSFPPYGVKDLCIRITAVDLGDLLNGIVKVEAVEDIFSLTKTTFGFSDSTEWQPADNYPTGVQIFAYLELPYELTRAKDSYVNALAVQPDEKTLLWRVWRENDNLPFEVSNEMSKWAPAGRLVYNYNEFTDAEDELGFEVVDLGGVAELNAPEMWNFHESRNGARLCASGSEIMAYSSINKLPNGNWQIGGVIRGVYDTVPQKHGSGAAVYFLESGYMANVAGSGPVAKEGKQAEEHYNITTATSEHEEEFDRTKTRSFTTGRRPERPCVPGKVRMNAHLLTDEVHAENVWGDLKITWQPRDKMNAVGCVSQDDIEDYWTKQPFVLPAGCEYIVRVYIGGDLVQETAGADPWFDYTWAERCKADKNLMLETEIEIACKDENGLESYQSQKRTFQWRVPTVVNVMSSEALAANCAQAWDIGDQIAVPAVGNIDAFYVDYAALPIILVGPQAQASDLGALMGHDGYYYLPDKAVLFEDGRRYKVQALAEGFTAFTRFMADGSAVYVRYNGTEFEETTLDGKEEEVE